MLVIEIPGRPPTPNARANWPEQYRERLHWRDVATQYAVAARLKHDAAVRPAPAMTPLVLADVEITFVVPTRARRDLDNLIGSTKPLTDGIVLGGVLKDDSTAVIRRMMFDVLYDRGRTATIYVVRSFT
jgi:Holliday junction resolvase RusA-like endonuclease